MNLLEYYINEVLSEKDNNDGTVDVKYTTTCWGVIDTFEKTLPKDIWENWKEVGFYIG